MKTGLQFLLKHIVSILICVFAVSVFSAAILNNTTKYILWLLLLIIYFGLFYTHGWKMGKVDNKPYNDIKPSILRVIKPWLVTLVVPFVLIVLYMFNGASPVYKLIGNVWYLPLSLLYNNGTGNLTPLHICYLSLVMPIFLSIGYLVGTTGFSIQDKMEIFRLKNIQNKKQAAQAERDAIIEQRKKNRQ